MVSYIRMYTLLLYSDNKQQPTTVRFPQGSREVTVDRPVTL